MGISSADLAGISAQDAQHGVEDLNAQIRWLMARVADLEARLAIEPEPCPELPSERRQRIGREYFAAERLRYLERTGGILKVKRDGE